MEDAIAAKLKNDEDEDNTESELRSAFREQTKNVVPDYGGGSGNPLLASYGDAPMSHPPKGSVAVRIENLLPQVEAEVVKTHLKSLLREGQIPRIPQPYWDPKLIKDHFGSCGRPPSFVSLNLRTSHASVHSRDSDLFLSKAGGNSVWM